MFNVLAGFLLSFNQKQVCKTKISSQYNMYRYNIATILTLFLVKCISIASAREQIQNPYVDISKFDEDTCTAWK